jgi:ribosomal protein L37AE/L43A
VGTGFGQDHVQTKSKKKESSEMQLQSTLTCPSCSFQAVETMPTDACQFFYVCKGCGEKLKPLPGDCCVFCSYGSVPCPPIQESGKSACCS